MTIVMQCVRYHSSLSPFLMLMNDPLNPLGVMYRKWSVILCESAVFEVKNTL